MKRRLKRTRLKWRESFEPDEDEWPSQVNLPNEQEMPNQANLPNQKEVPERPESTSKLNTPKRKTLRLESSSTDEMEQVKEN